MVLKALAGIVSAPLLYVINSQFPSWIIIGVIMRPKKIIQNKKKILNLTLKIKILTLNKNCVFKIGIYLHVWHRL